MNKYFKRISGVCNGEYIYFWKSKALFDESINSIIVSDYNRTPELSYYGSKIRVNFNGNFIQS